MSAKLIRKLKIFVKKNICLRFRDVNSLLIGFAEKSQRLSSRYTVNIDSLPTRYGGKTNVTILPGAGIGPEIMKSTLKILHEAEAPLSYEVLEISHEGNSWEEFENVLTAIRRNKVALKGNVEIKSKDPHVQSRNVLLRKTLDLYVYVLCCKSYPGLENKFGDIDIIVIRQNTEGEYLMLEHEPRPGSVEHLKVLTRFNSERIAIFAFNYALLHKRREITVVHNADVEALTEGLFLEAAKTISSKYPSIKLSIIEIGLAMSKIISKPKDFDIILATNLNGSMVSNFLIGMLGGPGLIAGTNFSEDGIAVFEPGARNKGSSIVGKGIANPVAMIMAGVRTSDISLININMLEYLGYYKPAETIRNSIFATLVYDRVHTHDLGGSATTDEFIAMIIRHIRQQLRPRIQKKKEQSLHHQWKSYCNINETKVPQNKE